MSQTTFVDRYTLFWGTIWGFVSWYIIEKPVRIFQRYWDYTTAFAEIFAFGFLVRTFFAPWKNITDVKKKPGFDISEWAQRFVLNMTSRVIGIIVRLVAFMIGLFIEIALLIGGIVFLMVWFAYPALIVITIIFLTRSFF